MKKQKTSISQLISTWKLNQVLLASKMLMPVSTFKNKLNKKLTAYHFTEAEEQKLIGILHELAADILYGTK